MLRRNVGWLDRTLRLLVGFSLIPIGLFGLRGAEGNLTGIGGRAFGGLGRVLGNTASTR